MTSSFFVDAAGGTRRSLETSAFCSCIFMEAITMEYGGGSSYLSSPDGLAVPDVQAGVDVP